MKKKYYGRGRNRYSVSYQGGKRYVRSTSNNNYRNNSFFSSLFGGYLFFAIMIIIPIGIVYYLIKWFMEMFIISVPFIVLYLLYRLRKIDLRYYMDNAEMIYDSLIGNVCGLISVNLRRKLPSILISLFSLSYIVFIYKRIVELFFIKGSNILNDYYFYMYSMLNFGEINGYVNLKLSSFR